MKLTEIIKYREKSLLFFRKAGIILTKEEEQNIEIADFGLNNFENIGLSILTYVNTENVCAKELVLLPNQTCPEHTHKDGIDEKGLPFKGKEETFRCRFGQVYLYIEGSKNNPNLVLPNTKVTVFHEIILNPGEQFTLYPNTLHWFRAGNKGAVISEFSTTSRDQYDVFTDPNIIRIMQVEES